MLRLGHAFRHGRRCVAPARNYCQRADHDILGVSADATPAEVRAAFHRKALQLHPDIAGASSAAHYHRAREAMERMVSESRSTRPSWTREQPDPDDHSREYEAEMRRVRHEQQQRMQHAEADRASFLRGLKLLVAYVVIGAMAKYAAMWGVGRLREAELRAEREGRDADAQ